MQRKTGIIIGAATVALTAGSPMLVSTAAALPIPAATSYADLLEPVPNAAERLNLADSTAGFIAPQYQDQGRQAHHHHHHHHSRRWYRSHGYVWNGGAWVMRPVDHHHHHHHSNY